MEDRRAAELLSIFAVDAQLILAYAEIPDETKEIPAFQRLVEETAFSISTAACTAEDYHHAIPAFNGIQWLQDRLTFHIKVVAAHPLNFPDPDCDAGQLGGLGVNLDALDTLTSAQVSVVGRMNK